MTSYWPRLFVLLTFALSDSAAALAQSAPEPEAILERRILRALRLSGEVPTIDGALDEAVWSAAPVARGFVQSSPRPAAAASLTSEARVLADDEALYVGLTYDDPDPHRIVAPFARRDDETTSDWAFVEIDSRRDRQSAFSFGVNPRGVQVDGLWLNDTAYDFAWNGVWQGAARRSPRGWTAELRIPFSQLAFALPRDGAPLLFGVNFYRYSPGHGESANWSPRYAALGGIVSHFNDLEVTAPSGVRRSEVTPYAAFRTGGGGRAGADLRLGLGPSFALTATLRPDFGQVEADPSQVNLSGFELFQAERRPFFLEGFDLFRFDTRLAFSSRGIGFGDDAPFYSRRIGRAPRGFRIDELPAATTLDGAAKLSGQTARGWTLGGFAAWSGAEEARLRDAEGAPAHWPVEARSRVSVGRAVKTLASGDAAFGLFAVDLHRSGLGSVLAPQLPSDARSAGVEARHRFHVGAYEWRGWALASEIAGGTEAVRRVAEAPRHLFQRPDGDRSRASYGTRLTGFAAESRLARLAGALRFSLSARAVSPGFDVDETGFQTGSDWLLLAGDWRLDRYPAGGPLRAWAVGSENLGWGWTFAGEQRAQVASAFVSFDWTNYWFLKLTATHELETLSIDWLRGGPALLLPPRDALALSLATDRRRPSFATLDLGAASEAASGSRAWSVSPLWNLRASDRIQGSIGPSYRVDTVGWQPLGRPAAGGRTRDLVARLEQRTLSFALRADLVVSPRLSFQLYAQPFATVGQTSRYQLARAPRDRSSAARFAPLAPGSFAASPAGGTIRLDLDGDGTLESAVALPDGARRELNASAVLRWEYHPGSTLSLVWNQRREATAAGGAASPASPASALTDLARDGAEDVLLLKVSRRFGR
jgi:hypothetical protein